MIRIHYCLQPARSKRSSNREPCDRFAAFDCHFSTMNDNARWSAVVARDPNANGAFVYCVWTTKIFCRPTCKARLARRSNVEFFDTAGQAQAAGYRPCKRCRPQLPSYAPEADKIQKACDVIQSLPTETPLPALDRLAKKVGLTKHHFHRLFKRETGLTPREYAIACRSGANSEPNDSIGTTPTTPSTWALDPQVPIDDRHAALPDVEQSTSNPAKESVAADGDILIIHYKVLETMYGCLLVAFQDCQVRKLELGSVEWELLQSLDWSFPSLHHLHCPLELADRQDVAIFDQQINAIIEALEHPSGKMVPLPLALSQ